MRLRTFGKPSTPREVTKPKRVAAESAVAVRALIDSGPLIALFNGADRWHPTVLRWLRANQQIRLYTTWPVLTEVCALLARRLNNFAALDFLRWVEPRALRIDRPEASSLADVLAISERLADLPFNLAEASIAEAAPDCLLVD